MANRDDLYDPPPQWQNEHGNSSTGGTRPEEIQKVSRANTRAPGTPVAWPL